MERGTWYLAPSVNLGVQHINASGYDEKGNAGLALSVEGASETYWYVKPGVEIGGTVELNNEALLRPSLNVSVTQFLGDTDLSANARFASAGDGISSFDSTSKLDRTSVEVAAGLDLITRNNTTLRADAIANFSEHVTEYGGSLRVEFRF